MSVYEGEVWRENVVLNWRQGNNLFTYQLHINTDLAIPTSQGTSYCNGNY